ncbi:MAG: amino acid ABC transporter ATP-binding protein, partial [Thermoactinospora sp.]|nr:amino acid ABC transporter ATP-binding protein [Thermoactinospora sp.]
MTMIIVTHEMSFAREVADRCVFMEQGRVVATGTPEEIFDDPASPRLRAFLSRFSGRAAQTPDQHVLEEETTS